MGKAKQGIVSITRLGAKGQITLPARYRRALALSGEAALALIQVGDALVIAPLDEALEATTQRLQARMRQAGSSVDDLLTAAAEARAEIVREQFGVTAEE